MCYFSGVINLQVIKKDGTKENFNIDKVVTAINKSAKRVLVDFTDEDINNICNIVTTSAINLGKDNIDIVEMHNIVENALDNTNPKVAQSYRNYRNYKRDFVHMLDKVYKKSQSIMYIGDKENSNTDSALVSTKRSLIFNQLNKELYKKFFLTTEELQAIRDGYIYIHDMSARRDTMNCCLFDVANVLKGGFEMGNVWYNEPKTLDTAFDVIGDIVLSAASQQYGGFTISSVEFILEPYAEKSYLKYKDKYRSLGLDEDMVEKMSIADIERDFEQGFQGWEYKFNTVSSSRGDYPFITVTAGTGTGRFARMCTKIMLKVRMNGQGKPGHKKPVLFPKLVFLYDKNLHGPGKELEDVFEVGIECSAKTMYPDWLSLTGEGYIPSMYKKYGKIISPMGCVDGQEVITYKFHNVLYVESFKRMWDRISDEIADKGQSFDNDVNRIINLTESDVQIWDTKLKNFTWVKYLVRNMQDNWCDVNISNGRKLRTTLDHPFETERGVVKAEDLKPDDYIRINNTQYSQDEINVPSSLAWLQGFMLCDGCYQNHSIFASIAAEGEDDIEEYFKKACYENFNIAPETVVQNRGEKGRYKDLRLYSQSTINLKDIISYFTQLFGGVRKSERHVPNEVFSYNNDAKYAFLAGMIDADGYINNDGKHKYPTVQIGSTNKELAIQQMLLAQSLGMRAKLYANHYDNKDQRKVRHRVEFFPNKCLVDAIKCKKKSDKWYYFEDTFEDTTLGRIVDVKPLNIEQYSYDVTTESEHFEVSGVYSHNCRAFLSPWYERGGIEAADENDVPVFVGRFNIGVVSLHLPMILAKARQESQDFYTVLDYYLELIHGLHQRTYEYLGEMRASTNPLAYCEGGFYGGHLAPNDKIKPLLKTATASFGITALNELQQLYNKKSIFEDGNFALEVMQHINDKITQFKKEDGYLYAIYGTPAENLCGLQVEQFRKKYGIIENVSDREYVSNSFHCHVTEDITPIEKQDSEARFWSLLNGGKIQYVKYPIAYNKEAIKTLVRRAMEMGFYEGVNLSLAYCDDCGHEELEMDVCPVCGSKNLTKIERMNGYLSYSRVKGDTRLNSAKMAEIAERKSM